MEYLPPPWRNRGRGVDGRESLPGGDYFIIACVTLKKLKTKIDERRCNGVLGGEEGEFGEVEVGRVGGGWWRWGVADAQRCRLVPANDGATVLPGNYVESRDQNWSLGSAAKRTFYVAKEDFFISIIFITGRIFHLIRCKRGIGLSPSSGKF